MRQKLTYIITIVVAIFIGVIGTIAVCKYLPNETDMTLKEVSVKETDTISSGIENIYDAVLVIEAYKGNRKYSTGTGFVYKKDDKNGYVITNNHVVEGCDNIKVITTDGNEVEAKVLGTDEYADIAVLSMDGKAVKKVAQIGESQKSKLGDTVFTVGSPLGKSYAGTVTKGILSGKNREVNVSLSNGEYMLEVLQTDAAMNPGNSGGPLCNINGDVIGVNSLKLVQDEIEGMGFALPIEIVMSTVSNLEKGKKVDRPMLGISLDDVTNTYGLYLNGIYLDEEVINNETGVVVVTVSDDSPASRAKLAKGDVLLQINDDKITSVGQFRFLLYKYNVGDTITIKYYRDGRISDVKVKLDKSVE